MNSGHKIALLVKWIFKEN